MIEGVIRTRVGYAGGQTSDPDYGNIGDHTETVQIDFDPQRISYEDLLDIFWRSHTSTGHGWSRQYMNAVFYDNEKQQQFAMSSKAVMEKKLGMHLMGYDIFMNVAGGVKVGEPAVDLA